MALKVFIEFIYLLLRVFYSLVKTLFCRLLAKRKDIRNKKILITGTAHGIGQQLAIKFGALGANVILWDINEYGNKETARIICSNGGKASTYTVDISKPSKVYETADMVKRDVGKVDILINNAGILNGIEFLRLTDEQIKNTIDINLMSHFWTLRAFLPGMIENGSGHIVNISSAAGKLGAARLVDYSASKHAVLGLTYSLQQEFNLEKKNFLKTTTICPYFVNTGMTKHPVSRFLPILETEYVAEQIVDGILKNKNEIILPFSQFLIFHLYTMLPQEASQLIYEFFGSYIEAQDKNDEPK